MLNINTTSWLVHGLLRIMAANYRFRPKLRRYLQSRDGWMNFTIGIKTLNDSVRQSIRFYDGKATVLQGIPENCDTILQFKNEAVIKKMLSLTPDDVMNLLLKNEMSIRGNLSIMSKFNFLMSLLLEKKHLRMLAKKNEIERAKVQSDQSPTDIHGSKKLAERRTSRLSAQKCDEVQFLEDPFLAEYSLDDFPRLKDFLDIHLTKKPEICMERPKHLTDWFRANGFETDSEGKSWNPVLRQAKAFNYLMLNKKPIIRKNDLLAGTTTMKEIGVVLYPDTHGNMIWGELKTVPYRILNPYDITDEACEILHNDIFPFWEKRNVREWVRREYNEPICQQLDERFAVYFLWKTAAVSHTIPDFPKLLRLGTEGMIREIRDELSNLADLSEEKKNLLEAMIMTHEGLNQYAANLSKQAKKDALSEPYSTRRKELSELADICAHVPRYPARTLHEAVNAIWIAWIGLHMENTNAGLSLGRLDQWLQPFFIFDINKIESENARKEYISKAIELIGCFYMRCTDHLPLVPDIGNFLFGGSSSDQAITLGGVTPEGRNGVNDMTYIFLKVTEMLNIRDPNVNARYHPKCNSDTYLKRLCETNFITSATPSMHNDQTVMASLREFNYPEEHLRDWSATGCVEPTLSGRHIGHTNCMMMNMVAALEMALNNGRHPLMNWDVGPKTGIIENGDFETFEQFFSAFETQYRFLIDQACEYNNLLGQAHSVIRPTPFLSTFIEGCIKSGKDVINGGALYNTSGSACIGLADVTDSMMAVKTLIFDEKKVSFAEMKNAISNNFAESPILNSVIIKKTPKFGSGSSEAVDMANRIAKFTHDCYHGHENYRGGRYTAGFWSMSNHVAFGCLSGALPSGRLAGKPFTPGLTPQPIASENLLDPIHDVSKLNPEFMNNNIAFNVKIVPSANDTHQKAVEHIFNYVKTYFDLGGMQMQLNVVTSAILRDAMKHPENYRNLLVRISGYNAYFVTLNRDMQLELIERAEYGIS